MTKAEMNYKRDYGHKDSEELALNYTRDSMKEELDGVLEKVTLDNLTADEQEYIDGRDQCRNHTLNIRFNDTQWEHICKQADLLKMRKSSYDQDDMKNIVGAVRGLAANVNQVARRVNGTGRAYSEDITSMKASVNEIWQLLDYIQSGVQCATALNTSWTGIRPEVMHLSSLLCARQNLSEQPNNSELSDNGLEQDEAPPKHST